MQRQLLCTVQCFDSHMSCQMNLRVRNSPTIHRFKQFCAAKNTFECQLWQAHHQTGVCRATCIQLQMLELLVPVQIHLAAAVGGGHPSGRGGFSVTESGAA